MLNANPYRPPEIAPEVVDDDLEVPIRFGGQLGLEEMAVWMPKKFAAELLETCRSNWVFLLVCSAFCLYGVHSWRQGEPILLVSYLAMAALVMPIYGVLRVAWWHYRNGTVAMLEQRLTETKPCRGFFDSQGGVWQDEFFVGKFAWEDAIVSNEAAAITLNFWGSDTSYYLPTRFFASQDDYQRLRCFLQKKFSSESKPPSWGELDDQVFDGLDMMSIAEVQKAQQWSETNWPFERTSEEVLELKHQPNWRDWSFKDRLIYIAGQVGYFVLGWLPVHLAYWIWIAAVYFSGDVSSVWSNGELGHLIYLGFFGMIAWAQIQHHIHHRKIQNQPIKIQFDASGSLTRQGEDLIWIPFAESMRFISSEHAIGWDITGRERSKMELPRRRMTPEFAEQLETLLRSSLRSDAGSTN